MIMKITTGTTQHTLQFVLSEDRFPVYYYVDWPVSQRVLEWADEEDEDREFVYETDGGVFAEKEWLTKMVEQYGL